MDEIAGYLEARRVTTREVLRKLIGERDRPAPTGARLMEVLARPFAESGLMLQGPVGPRDAVVATSDEADGPRVLLLYDTDEPRAEPEPGGGRAGLVAALASLAAIRATRPALPVTVTLVCEPDRGRGSASVGRLRLPAQDLCLWDGGGFGQGQPWLVLGSHGLLRLRLRVSGAGGPPGLGALVANPAWRLIWALSTIKSPAEEIHLPAFYERVREPTAAEVAALALIAPDLAQTIARQGSEPLLGLRGPNLALVQAFSPAISITNLGVEASPLGLVPSQAWADLRVTLVPVQRVEAVVASLAEHLAAHRLGDLTIETETAYESWETPADAPLVRLVAHEAATVTGAAPVLVPYAAEPAPLSLLAAGVPLPAVGLGPGHAPWPWLEERVLTHAYLMARVLLRLPALAGR